MRYIVICRGAAIYGDNDIVLRMVRFTLAWMGRGVYEFNWLLNILTKLRFCNIAFHSRLSYLELVVSSLCVIQV